MFITSRTFKLISICQRIGSYGLVYKGREKKTGEIVAIKIILLDDENSVEDVRKEIQILAACHHENIVKYHGSYFKGENLWYFVLFAYLNLI